MRNMTDLSIQPIAEDAFRKSSYSGGGSGSECVEVAPLAGGAAIRDSKNKAGAVLRVHAEQMAAFVTGVKDGKFDLPA